MTATRAGKGTDSAGENAHRTSSELPSSKAPSHEGWQLSHGRSLPEFALEAGFLAPRLLSLDSHIRPLADLSNRTGGRSRR
jgi:hypothetical protein